MLDPLEADDEFVLRTGHTYSGHATCCAAGLVNIDLLEKEGLLARADHIGDRLGGALQALAASGTLPEVRGVGGMWGFSLPEGVDGGALTTALIERGVIGRALAGNNYGFFPPLCIDDADLDLCSSALTESLAELMT